MTTFQSHQSSPRQKPSALRHCVARRPRPPRRRAGVGAAIRLSSAASTRLLLLLVVVVIIGVELVAWRDAILGNDADVGGGDDEGGSSPLLLGAAAASKTKTRRRSAGSSPYSRRRHHEERNANFGAGNPMTMISHPPPRPMMMPALPDIGGGINSSSTSVASTMNVFINQHPGAPNADAAVAARRRARKLRRRRQLAARNGSRLRTTKEGWREWGKVTMLSGLSLLAGYGLGELLERPPPWLVGIFIFTSFAFMWREIFY